MSKLCMNMQPTHHHVLGGLPHVIRCPSRALAHLIPLGITLHEKMR